MLASGSITDLNVSNLLSYSFSQIEGEKAEMNLRKTPMLHKIVSSKIACVSEQYVCLEIIGIIKKKKSSGY